MSGSAITANVRESLHTQRNITAQVALDPVIPLEHGSYLDRILISKILHPGVRVHSCLIQYLFRVRATDTENPCEAYLDTFVLGQINSGDSCQLKPP